ncbi:uncharacterized protein LOC119187395 isoform X3 [Rhipicephalus microplus]|uniref:uncharacterized protein LOC119187395 isoform X3 n=1 Tax=Rhipicephalus microplus TaxID=6941 RepID=UPI003F6A9BD8
MNHNKWAKQNHPPARVKARVVTITSGLPSPWADEADHEATSDEAGSFFKKTTAISDNFPTLGRRRCSTNPKATTAPPLRGIWGPHLAPAIPLAYPTNSPRAPTPKRQQARLEIKCDRTCSSVVPRHRDIFKKQVGRKLPRSKLPG